uniref:Ig-like domain-containing protein n=1 Tax=Meleagris gallopavo TaxID=9103 RepID=A0A803YCE8_MELGA
PGPSDVVLDLVAGALGWLGNFFPPLALLHCSSGRFRSAGVCAQLRIVEAGGGLREPGESVSLSCQGFGSNFKSYHVFWYRQACSGHLHWLSYASSSPFYTSFSPKMEHRATASRDNDHAVASLSLCALHPHDSARYFCAVHTGTGNPPEL